MKVVLVRFFDEVASATMVEVLLLPIRVNPYAAMHATERWQLWFVPARKVAIVEVRAPLASHLAHFFCLVVAVVLQC